MKVTIHDPGHVVLRRGIRAGIGVPLASLLALILLPHSPAGIVASYGSFCLIAICDFVGSPGRRVTPYLWATLAGAVVVVLGILASQTLASAERFTTPELLELERELAGAEDLCRRRETALFAALLVGASPANVNYRYLEDELVYLLENSDAEALLFHGALGEHVAKVVDRAPGVRCWIQIDDGSPHQEFAERYEDLIAATEPMPRIPRSGDDLYFLYTGGTTGMPKGVMWRCQDLWEVLAESVYPLVGETRPESAAVRPTSRPVSSWGTRLAVAADAKPIFHPRAWSRQQTSTSSPARR